MKPVRTRSRPGTRAGFTLIEILVVLIIISILAGIVTVSVMRKPGEARIAAARMQVNQLRTAVKLYQAEQGAPPTQDQGLQALVEKPATDPVPRNYPAEGYIESPVVPADPWGNPYIYLAPGRRQEPFEIICYGSDGEPGGEGDATDISSSLL